MRMPENFDAEVYAVVAEKMCIRDRHRTAHNGARALHSLHNLLGRFVHEIVIE